MEQKPKNLLNSIKIEQKAPSNINLLQSQPLLSKSEQFQSGFQQIGKQNRNEIFKQEKKQASHFLEKWDPSQIERLFKYYDVNGPQWKNMSMLMPERTANNLKNKFYTVLRNLIKSLFRKNSENCPKLTGEISSKDLCRLYDGREDYSMYAGFLPELLQQLDYDIENEKLDSLLPSRTQQVLGIYKIIYKEKLAEMQTARNKQVQKSRMGKNSQNMMNQFSFGHSPIAYPKAESGIIPSLSSSENVIQIPINCYYYIVPQPTVIWGQSFF